MFIRTLILLTASFSFGQSFAAQCPDFGRTAIQCYFPVNSPTPLLEFESQKANENDVMAYTFIFMALGDSERLTLIADGSAHTLDGSHNANATCSDGVLTIDINGSKTARFTFTQQQDGRMEMTVQSIGASGKSPVFEASCSPKK